MADWKPIKLGNLAFVGRRKSRHQPRNTAFLSGGHYPFFQTGDIKAANFYLTESSQTSSDEGVAQRSSGNREPSVSRLRPTSPRARFSASKETCRIVWSALWPTLTEVSAGARRSTLANEWLSTTTRPRRICVRCVRRRLPRSTCSHCRGYRRKTRWSSRRPLAGIDATTTRTRKPTRTLDAIRRFVHLRKSCRRCQAR